MRAGLGSAVVEPAVGDAGECSTWRVAYRVGPAGIRRGGGIRVQLPNAWHVGEQNSAKGVQSEDAAAPNYVTARASRPGSVVLCTVESGSTAAFVKNLRVGLDGRIHRYAYVVRVVVEREDLVESDEIEVVFGDRSGGSVGFRAGYFDEGQEPVAVAVDASGGGSWERLPDADLPRIEIRHGEPDELLVVAPSLLAVGERGRLRLSLVDLYGNRIEQFEGSARIRVLGEDGCWVPPEVELMGGTAAIPIDPGREGVWRFDVTLANGLRALSNPIVCIGSASANGLYWGDLHVHADASYDATGRHPFEYGLDIASLDFMALTEHAERWSPSSWDLIRSQAERFNHPGRFVTLVAYEATFGSPWGHHNVYFRSHDGPVVGAHSGSLPDLWAALTAGEAFTVPHHTGVCFSGSPEDPAAGRLECPNPDWHYHDRELRPLVEIYSGHGQSERYDPDDPLSYEHCGFSFDTSIRGPHYAWDAWRMGHQLGVIASSDNHHGQPGRGEMGLAGVWAPSLTRESLFDALLARRTFGTTGCRTILWFTVNDTPMGGVTDAREGATFRVRVHATTPIARVEVIAGDIRSGRIAVVHAWSPEGLDFDGESCDASPPDRGFYYVRVTQRGEYRGRALMAWTSPVWVDGGARQRDV